MSLDSEILVLHLSPVMTPMQQRALYETLRQHPMVKGISKLASFVPPDPKKNEPAVYRQPVTELKLSTRAFHCLAQENIRTIEDLMCYSMAQLNKVPNLGKQTLEEIVLALASYDLQLNEK